MSQRLMMETLERLVHSPEFDEQCIQCSKRNSSSSTDTDYSFQRGQLWETRDDSSVFSVEPSGYAVSKLEAHLYYHGIRGDSKWGPKLIARSSQDSYVAPSGAAQDARVMTLLPVSEHARLSNEKDLWPTIRSETVILVDQRGIKLTSVDLACFSWEEQNDDYSSKFVITNATIWVGVYPDSTTSDVAYDCCSDILHMLNKHGISDIDVAFRESVAQTLRGQVLYAPVDDLHHLKDVIDPLTTALGMPIAGSKTPYMQGTLGFFFRVGEDLYGVTARHVLFPEEGGNDEYNYVTGPKKEVVVMGTKAFNDLLVSIQARIGTLKATVGVLERRVETYTKTVAAGDSTAVATATKLAVTKTDLASKRQVIEELREFYMNMKKYWENLDDRIIGYVVWAPPISLNTAPHGYTKDVCIIKLDKKKFGDNFKGNIIDLGPEIDSGDFITKMYSRDDAQSEFKYPEDRLYKVFDIVSEDEIHNPNIRDHNNDKVRYVIKRGLTTKTTIGRMSGFDSYERRYTILGPLSSIEVAIFPYDNNTGPFSRGGDSGSLIADARCKFGALLTGGTGPTNSSDITYGTAMFWLWKDIIKIKFPDGNLYFED